MDAVQFILHRKTTLAGALLPIPVYINGQYVGTIHNGKTLVANVPHASVYYIEDKPFSEKNAVLYGDSRTVYRILLMRAGGWHTVSYNEFYIEQDGQPTPAPSFSFERLHSAIFENKMQKLSSTERVLALCIEFEYGLRDDIQEILASENLYSIAETLQNVGARQYAELLQNILHTDFSDVPLPLGDEQIEEMKNKIKRANEKVRNNRSAYNEFHKAFIRYLLCFLENERQA